RKPFPPFLVLWGKPPLGGRPPRRGDGPPLRDGSFPAGPSVPRGGRGLPRERGSHFVTGPCPPSRGSPSGRGGSEPGLWAALKVRRVAQPALPSTPPGAACPLAVSSSGPLALGGLLAFPL